MPSPSLQSTLEGTKSMIAVVLEPLEVATRSRNGSRGPSRISDYRLYSLFTAASIVCTCSSVNQDHVLVTYNAVYVNHRSKIYWSSSSSSKLNKARNIESRTHQCVYTYCTHSTHIVSNIKPVYWMMHNMPNTSHTHTSHIPHVTHPTRHTHPTRRDLRECWLTSTALNKRNNARKFWRRRRERSWLRSTLQLSRAAHKYVASVCESSRNKLTSHW